MTTGGDGLVNLQNDRVREFVWKDYLPRLRAGQAKSRNTVIHPNRPLVRFSPDRSIESFTIGGKTRLHAVQRTASGKVVSTALVTGRARVLPERFDGMKVLKLELEWTDPRAMSAEVHLPIFDGGISIERSADSEKASDSWGIRLHPGDRRLDYVSSSSNHNFQEILRVPLRDQVLLPDPFWISPEIFNAGGFKRRFRDRLLIDGWVEETEPTVAFDLFYRSGVGRPPQLYWNTLAETAELTSSILMFNPLPSIRLIEDAFFAQNDWHALLRGLGIELVK
jgi:hypothetical protein